MAKFEPEFGVEYKGGRPRQVVLMTEKEAKRERELTDARFDATRRAGADFGIELGEGPDMMARGNMPLELFWEFADYLLAKQDDGGVPDGWKAKDPALPPDGMERRTDMETNCAETGHWKVIDCHDIRAMINSETELVKRPLFVAGTKVGELRLGAGNVALLCPTAGFDLFVKTTGAKHGGMRVKHEAHVDREHCLSIKQPCLVYVSHDGGRTSSELNLHRIWCKAFDDGSYKYQDEYEEWSERGIAWIKACEVNPIGKTPWGAYLEDIERRGKVEQEPKPGRSLIPDGIIAYAKTPDGMEFVLAEDPPKGMRVEIKGTGSDARITMPTFSLTHRGSLRRFADLLKTCLGSEVG